MESEKMVKCPRCGGNGGPWSELKSGGDVTRMECENTDCGLVSPWFDMDTLAFEWWSKPFGRSPHPVEPPPSTSDAENRAVALGVALSNLIGELHGTLSVNEDLMRSVVGNTNINALKFALATAQHTLSDPLSNADAEKLARTCGISLGTPSVPASTIAAAVKYYAANKHKPVEQIMVEFAQELYDEAAEEAELRPREAEDRGPHIERDRGFTGKF